MSQSFSIKGETILEVQVAASERVAPGTLSLSFCSPNIHTERLSGPTLDPLSKCP